MKAHKTQQAVTDGRVTMGDFQGSQEATVVANLGAGEHVPHKPFADWLLCQQVAKMVRHFWLLVGPKLRERLEAWPCVRLPTPEVEPDIPQELPVEMFPWAPQEVGPQERVVEYDELARCLDCCRQTTGKVKAPGVPAALKKFKQRRNSAPEVERHAPVVEPAALLLASLENIVANVKSNEHQVRRPSCEVLVLLGVSNN
eukprot:3804035-Amphidinium_carterae.3